MTQSCWHWKRKGWENVSTWRIKVKFTIGLACQASKTENKVCWRSIKEHTLQAYWTDLGWVTAILLQHQRSLVKRFNKIAGDEDPVNITEYHSAIGCLICASIATRTDLSSAVGALSQHMLKPGKEHWIGVKRIFRYIQGTLDYGLLHQSRREGKIHLQGYTDADWAGTL